MNVHGSLNINSMIPKGEWYEYQGVGFGSPFFLHKSLNLVGTDGVRLSHPQFIL